MNAYVENEPNTDIIRLWMFTESPGGDTVWMWPTGREHGRQVWTQEIVPAYGKRPDHIMPVLEMSGQMWKACIAAIFAEGEVPANKVLLDILKREQNRVDALLHALIKANEPQMYLTSTPQEGKFP